MSTSENHMSLLFVCAASQPHFKQIQQYLSVHQAQLSLSLKPDDPDLHLVNAEDETLTIEAVRNTIPEMALKPFFSPQSTFVLFHIENASVAAQNALLKAVEEPPGQVQIIITTDRLEKVVPTIVSRCQVVDIRSAGETVLSAFDTQEIAELYAHRKNLTATAIFALSEKYKEREAAVQFIEQFLTWLHQQNESQSTSTATQHLQKLIHAQTLLEQNVNVRLVLEDLLFSLKL